MIQRSAPLVALGLLLLLTTACPAPEGPPPFDNPDILLLTVDTLRADRMGFAGYEAARTPNLDALANEGTIFLAATTPFPRTTPGLASLLSGLWPQNHGSREVGQHLNDEVILLSQMLTDRGYHTLGLTANGAASSPQGFDRGFVTLESDRDLPNRRATAVTERALELLASAPEDKPLFLWVHYIDPHYPYTPPKPWSNTPNAEPCLQMMRAANGERQEMGWVFNDLDGRSSSVLDSCGELYDAEVAYADHEIGRLLEDFDTRRTLDDTLLIFTADHGENLGEDGLFYQHGPNVHDASLRVPLFFHGPGIEARRDNDIARLEDVMPTVLNLLGVPESQRPEMDGTDLSHRLRDSRFRRGDERFGLAESGSALLLHSFNSLHSGRKHERHCLNGPQYSLCGAPDEEPGLYDHTVDPRLTTDLSDEYPDIKRQMLAAREVWPPEQARERSIFDGRYKLVERPRIRGGYRIHLYDLEEDPEATRDLARERPDEVRRLTRALEAWTTTLPGPQVEKLDEEQLEVLRTLGYID